MEQRAKPRTKRRIPCVVRTVEREYRGIVIDMSDRGLFVQLMANLAINARVEVEIRIPGSEEPISMNARVARKRLVPAQLQTVGQGGLGLRIPNPPKAFLDFVAAHMPGARTRAAS